MIQLVCSNTIGYDSLLNLNIFDFVSEIEINSSWEDLTDTAFIKLPQKLKLKNNKDFSITAPSITTKYTTTGTVVTTSGAIFKRNQPVILNLGYRNYDPIQKQYVTYINNCFTGFIKRVYPRRPLEFECEDMMMQLKQITIPNYPIPGTQTFINKGTATLDVIMSEIITPAIRTKFNFTLAVEAIQVINLSFLGGVTIAEVFDYFKKLFGVAIYFQNGVLNIGFPYKLGRNSQTPIGPFDFNTNIITDKLDYMRADDVLVQVSVINFSQSNVKTIYGPFGTAGGDNITVYTFDKTAAFCADFGKQWVEKYQYEGYRGSFETFLLPKVNHGDAVKIADANIPDRNGVYLVKRVITRFGTSGGRQEIFLHKKL
jgi:hypothetical protein